MAADDRAARPLTPEQSLADGRWVKLICGASNQDQPAIADLCAVFAAAGVDCIDVAADPAVVRAARQGLESLNTPVESQPWLMVSISDGVDAHFRKAWFDPNRCPTDCHRPCERVCPAEAISAEDAVDDLRCYGCGRCLPACPHQLIEERDHRLATDALAELMLEIKPDAVEVHTAPGRAAAFDAVLKALATSEIPLQRLAVSCGLEGHALTPRALSRELWMRHSSLRRWGFRPLWQLDGRPMSGDVGSGTARAAVHLWRSLRPLAPPGPLQLAGGTNASTVGHIAADERPAGIAYGGAARRLLLPLLDESARHGGSLRDWPEGWQQALTLAKTLVDAWRQRPLPGSSC